MRFYATTFNMKCFLPMPRHCYTDDVEAARDVAGSLLFWQEAGWLRWVRRIIRRKMPYVPGASRRWGHHFPGGSSGISFDWRRWWPGYRGRCLLHRGKWALCDRRFIAEMIATPARTDIEVGLGSAHWAPKRGGRGVPLQIEGNRNARNWIYRHVNHNRPCILAGDANQTGKFLGDQVKGKKLHYVQGDVGGGIDFLIFVDSDDYEWKVSRRRVFKGRHSDHDPVRVHVQLVRKRV